MTDFREKLDELIDKAIADGTAPADIHAALSEKIATAAPATESVPAAEPAVVYEAGVNAPAAPGADDPPDMPTSPEAA